MTTTTYTTTENPCDCFEDFALAITVKFDEEGFGDIPVFHNEMEDLCSKCLEDILADDSLLNLVVEPKLTLF